MPFLSPGDLPDPGIEPPSLVSPALAGRFFTTMPLLLGRLSRRFRMSSNSRALCSSSVASPVGGPGVRPQGAPPSPPGLGHHDLTRASSLEPALGQPPPSVGLGNKGVLLVHPLGHHSSTSRPVIGLGPASRASLPRCFLSGGERTLPSGPDLRLSSQHEGAWQPFSLPATRSVDCGGPVSVGRHQVRAWALWGPSFPLQR